MEYEEQQKYRSHSIVVLRSETFVTDSIFILIIHMELCCETYFGHWYSYFPTFSPYFPVHINLPNNDDDEVNDESANQ